MIKIEKHIDEDGFNDIDIIMDGQIIRVTYARNFDLYVSYISRKSILDLPESIEFIIPNTYNVLYELLLQLYNAIDNNTPYNNFPSNNDLKAYKICFSEIARNRLLNSNEITWYSDDYDLEYASYLKIINLGTAFKIILGKSKNHPSGILYPLTYSVRISNSGSKYAPFNSSFMGFYHALLLYDFSKLEKRFDKEKLLTLT